MTGWPDREILLCSLADHLAAQSLKDGDRDLERIRERLKSPEFGIKMRWTSNQAGDAVEIQITELSADEVEFVLAQMTGQNRKTRQRPGPKPRGITIPLQVLLSRRERDILDRYCQDNNVTMGEAVRLAIRKLK